MNGSIFDSTKPTGQQLIYAAPKDARVLMVSEDRLRLKLREYVDSQRRVDWVTPFAIAIGAAGNLLTAEKFKEFLGLEGPVWKAVFVIVLVLSVAATIFQIVRAYLSSRNKISENDFINDFCAGSLDSDRPRTRHQGQ